MNYFYWNKKFDTGIEIIDDQHKQLVYLINQYSLAFSSQSDLPELEKSVKLLTDYIEFHFRDEEKELLKSTLTNIQKENHLDQHQVFTHKVAELLEVNDLSDYQFAEKLHQFLTSWLVSHILGTDMVLAKAMRGLSVDPLDIDLPMDVTHVEYVLLSALNESEQRFRFFTDNSPTIIWIADYKGRRIFQNQVYQDFVDNKDALDSDKWAEFVHEDDRQSYVDLLCSLDDQAINVVAEFRLLRYDGQYRDIYERIIPRFESDGCFIGHIGSSMDITELKQAEKILVDSHDLLENEVKRRTDEINKLVTIDELTGVGNRRYLNTKLNDEHDRANRYQRPLSILFIDADYFKKVNDTFGHVIGDRVLKALADCLYEGLRNTDFIGRFGGEEFLIILPETGIESATFMAERICERVRELQVPGCSEQITISVGVAQSQKSESIDAFIARSDSALYLAKNTGRDRVIQST